MNISRRWNSATLCMLRLIVERTAWYLLKNYQRIWPPRKPPIYLYVRAVHLRSAWRARCLLIVSLLQYAFSPRAKPRGAFRNATVHRLCSDTGSASLLRWHPLLYGWSTMRWCRNQMQRVEILSACQYANHGNAVPWVIQYICCCFFQSSRTAGRKSMTRSMAATM